MNLPYSPLLSPPKNSPYRFQLTERHLQVIWFEQKYLYPLSTTENEEIEVICPGIWNQNEGPDFLKAHLKIGSREYRGDVEIHLSDQGWYQHGHHRDCRYNQVILHIAYWQSAHFQNINKENGRQVSMSYFDSKLTVPIERLGSLIDLDFYPSRIRVKKGNCSDQLFEKLSETEIRSFLKSAAFWRLDRKLNYLQQNIPDASLQLVAGIAIALGYKKNANAFLEMFLESFPFRDLPREELLALFLGTSGFFDKEKSKQWQSSGYYRTLNGLWDIQKDTILFQINFNLSRIRPLNNPIRRLVYLSYLLQDPHLEKLGSGIKDLWEKTPNTKKGLKMLQLELLALIPLYSDVYWNYHYTFEEEKQKKILPLIGKEFKVHVLLNTILPLLYGMIKGSQDAKVWDKFQNFYSLLRTADTEKSRYLLQRFWPTIFSQKFLREAQLVQGAYQLHQDFCAHYESSCEGCPFVERYVALS